MGPLEICCSGTKAQDKGTVATNATRLQLRPTTVWRFLVDMSCSLIVVSKKQKPLVEVMPTNYGIATKYFGPAIQDIES